MDDRSTGGGALPFVGLVAVSLSIGWGIRGNFGHEFGAMLPGALAGMAVALLSGRPDWQRRVSLFGAFGAIGWAFGGSISYMHVIAYTHSGQLSSVLYGFACLFVIGFLWAAVGGAGTALPAYLIRADLDQFFAPLAVVFAAWWIEWRVIDLLQAFNPAFRNADPLDWYDTNWLDALVAPAAILALAAIRRRLDRPSRLIFAMSFGWWAGFLILVIGLGLRMTPPRGDNWAGSLGMVVAMLIWLSRAGMAPVVLASLIAGFVGGLGFASATLFKLVEMTTAWHTNWHSILEQTYGLINGTGIAIAMLALARRLPVQDCGESAEGAARSRRLDALSVAFLLLAVTFVNLRKAVDEWVRAGAVAPLLYGIPSGWWFDAAYACLAVVLIASLARHLRRPLPIIPASVLGKGQLLYLVFLWWIVIGNLMRALVAFAPQRLVTEGVIHLNACICTAIVLLASSRSPIVPARPPDLRSLIPRTIGLGLAAWVVTTLFCWGIVRAVYGNRFAGEAGFHVRFNPHL